MATALAPGQIVRVRSRQYVVEDVVADRNGESRLVKMASLEDDAQGEPLEVLWKRELDAEVVGAATWDAVARRGFDEPRLFSAYLHTLKWNCVTSTDAKLFQAPYRAGIEVKAYQLEPLRMALHLPRVNLFIADDAGLGKTIEAGLILRELLMRQKQARIRDEDYAAPLRDWLDGSGGGSLLILDEAHNAAPARNLEAGLLVRDATAASNLASQFDGLVAKNVLQRVAGVHAGAQ